jgi:hypothetical protein
MKVLVGFAFVIGFASTALAQPDMSALQKTWQSFNRSATQEAKQVQSRLQNSARQLSKQVDAVGKSEHIRIAKEAWDLREHINVLAWLFGPDFAQYLRFDLRGLQSLVDFSGMRAKVDTALGKKN